MRNTARKRSRAVGGAGSAVMLCVALAGCGAGGSAATASTCRSPGVQGGSIRVGVAYSDTGAVSSTFTAARGGFEARIALANQEGGVDGRRIDVVWADDADTTSGNLAAAQDLVGRQGAFALGQLSIAASGSAAYLAGLGVPVVGFATEKAWDDYANMFSTAYDGAETGGTSTDGKFVAARGGTKAAIVMDAGSAASLSYSGAITASLHAAGVATVATIPFTGGLTSPQRTAATIAASHADVLIAQLDSESFRQIVAASREAGVKFKVALSSAIYDRRLLARSGGDLAGTTASVTHISFESTSPALTRFRDAVVRFAPEVDNPDQTVVVGGYGVADMLVTGLKEAGACPTRAAFIANLRNTRHYDASGLIPGGVDFSTNRGRPALCLTFMTVNPQGTAFQLQPAPNGGEQWCGTRLEG
ncbi:ABC transporter substrate-binding protein [Pseudofrankia inefficax]|uniref:Leucine-binding protein domain-containing protein n=1 Tax=Pseudofrankia inefficax (strain DSM 45817 / CECT 9037 / DDB 130130 / EuI1c) TaxID=298654 RepID=E3JAL7_PSEI1|nr:ABC transporter substrate-binding protein [Pseudofrankia inefficax]ADP82209.1 hypothetical protein FraEuI1c_4210 [Pseudofrankia inefficax]